MCNTAEYYCNTNIIGLTEKVKMLTKCIGTYTAIHINTYILCLNLLCSLKLFTILVKYTVP